MTAWRMDIARRYVPRPESPIERDLLAVANGPERLTQLEAAELVNPVRFSSRLALALGSAAWIAAAVGLHLIARKTLGGMK
jgi:hypothetical protein